MFQHFSFGNHFSSQNMTQSPRDFKYSQNLDHFYIFQNYNINKLNLKITLMNSQFCFTSTFPKTCSFSPLLEIQSSFTFYQKIDNNQYRNKSLIVSKSSLYISQIEPQNQFSIITYDSKFEIMKQTLKLKNIDLVGIKFQLASHRTREFYTQNISDLQKLKIILRSKMHQTSLLKFYKPLKKILIGDYFNYYSAVRIDDQKNVIIKSHSKQYGYSSGCLMKKIINQIKILKMLRQKQFKLLIEVFESDVSLYFILDIDEGCSFSKYFKDLSNISFLQTKRIVFNIINQIKFFNSVGIYFDLQLLNIFALQDSQGYLNIKLINFQNALYHSQFNLDINQSKNQSQIIRLYNQNREMVQFQTSKSLQNTIQMIKLILQTKLKHTIIKSASSDFKIQVQRFIDFISYQIFEIDQIINHQYFEQLKICQNFEQRSSTIDSLSEKGLINPIQNLNEQQLNEKKKYRSCSFDIQNLKDYFDNAKYGEKYKSHKKSKFRCL